MLPDMDTLLASLDAKALDDLASAHADFARRAKARAAELRALEDMRKIAATAHFSLIQCPLMLIEYLDSGMDLARACERLARELGVPVETVAHHWRRWMRSKAEADVRARDLWVMRYAARGWRNDAIAQRTGLHPVSVSRIVSRAIGRKKGPREAARGGEDAV